MIGVISIAYLAFLLGVVLLGVGAYMKFKRGEDHKKFVYTGLALFTLGISLILFFLRSFR